MRAVATIPYNPDFEPEGFSREFFYSECPGTKKGLIFMSFEEKELKHFKDWDDAERYTKGELAA